MADEVVKEAEVDPEPEGVIEIPKPEGKERVVPVAVLTAERDRIRKSEAEKHAKELEPLRQKAALADQLSADLATVQPYIEKLKAKPELMREHETPEQQQIPDQEAEQFARQYELYTPNGLDVNRARKIIASQNAKMEQVARQAAEAAVRPVAERTNIDKSRANFIAAAQARDAQGRQLVDPQILAQQWALVPPELSAQQDVAELILDRAIGAMYRSGRQAPAHVDREPVFSEPAGGRSGGYTISDEEKKFARSAGLDDKKWAASASKFVPGQTNVIGE